MALKWATPNSEFEIEDAGRVCWESWGKSDGTIECARDFIRRLKKVGHIDVFEEAELSVWIEGSRTMSHQLVRHRTQHHLQASQRYIKASDCEIMLPPSLGHNGERALFVNACQTAFESYQKLTEAGVRKEDARFVLPNATLTVLKAKANFSNWRKFIELRSHSTSQWEIRMISDAILTIANELAPAVFEDLYVEFIDLGKDNPIADIVDRTEFGSFDGQGEFNGTAKANKAS